MRSRIIALAGVAGCGKDTVASFLPGPKVRFADPIKQFCAQVFGWSEEQLYGPSALREVPDPKWDGLTPRKALQTLGTEWGRAMHPDIWARAGVAMAVEVAEGRGFGDSPPPCVAIPDTRFKNEATAVQAAGGEVWLIVRPGVGGGTHASELEVQSGAFAALVDRVIVNDGTLIDLQVKVLQAYARERPARSY